jgi:hypothetical protein
VGDNIIRKKLMVSGEHHFVVQHQSLEIGIPKIGCNQPFYDSGVIRTNARL